MEINSQTQETKNRNNKLDKIISIEEERLENIKLTKESGKLKCFENDLNISKYLIGSYTLYDPNHNLNQSSPKEKKYKPKILEEGIFIVGAEEPLLNSKLLYELNDNKTLKEIHNKIQQLPIEIYTNQKQNILKTRNGEFCKVELNPIENDTFEDLKKKLNEYTPEKIEGIGNSNYESPKINSNILYMNSQIQPNNKEDNLKNMSTEESSKEITKQDTFKLIKTYKKLDKNIPINKQYEMYSKFSDSNIDIKKFEQLSPLIKSPPVHTYKESKLIYIANKISQLLHRNNQ
jgi:hypothetical protein